jgi:hypothetical protein
MSVMRIGPDTVATALLECWEFLTTGNPSGWTNRSHPGVLAATTGVPVPSLNGVWVSAVPVDPGIVAELLDEVAATGLPHCLQVRPESAAHVTTLATDRQMTHEAHDIPLMVLDDSRALTTNLAQDGMQIRQLQPAEAELHATLAAAAFDVPVEPFLQLMTPTALSLPGVRCYLGEIDGEPVTTGLGVSIGPHVGIFNIATPAEHRRRGYGAAVTARAVADGLTAGATWAWLQSSEAGHHVYETLGFRTTEQWSCWVSEGDTEETTA